MRRGSRVWLAVAAGATTVVLAVGVFPTVAGAATARAYCGITWGSQPKSTPTFAEGPMTGVRVGRHDCFDRLVVDLAARPASGYHVRYTDVYRAEGSGDPRLVAGGAVLHVSVLAPAYDENGHSTVPWAGSTQVVRPDQFQARGFRTFTDLVWGGSFEAHSSLGLGVRARLPFRVVRLDGPGDRSRLVIDVAHRW